MNGTQNFNQPRPPVAKPKPPHIRQFVARQAGVPEVAIGRLPGSEAQWDRWIALHAHYTKKDYASPVRHVRAAMKYMVDENCIAVPRIHADARILKAVLGAMRGEVDLERLHQAMAVDATIQIARDQGVRALEIIDQPKRRRFAQKIVDQAYIDGEALGRFGEALGARARSAVTMTDLATEAALMMRDRSAQKGWEAGLAARFIQAINNLGRGPLAISPAPREAGPAPAPDGSLTP